MAVSKKVAVVTGGSRGIGAAVARTLARSGAALAITYNEDRSRAEQVASEIAREGGADGPRRPLDESPSKDCVSLFSLRLTADWVVPVTSTTRVKFASAATSANA
jgi:NAD(P)-dependent dehydrogenase (short-subunit alcohol dehydrogenase family)